MRAWYFALNFLRIAALQVSGGREFSNEAVKTAENGRQEAKPIVARMMDAAK